jgi:hypothetical protein
MVLQIAALWANTKKCHGDILTMAWQRTTLNFGGTFSFLELAAKSGRRAENSHFQILLFEFSTHNCRYNHETPCHDRT